jgi:hypothetical protein
MKTKTATPRGSSRKRDVRHDTSRDAQRYRLLARLRRGPVDTLVLRSEENILMPAARVKDLREAGHTIHVQRIKRTDDYGREHRGIALYSLVRRAAKSGVRS